MAAFSQVPDDNSIADLQPPRRDGRAEEAPAAKPAAPHSGPRRSEQKISHHAFREVTDRYRPKYLALGANKSAKTRMLNWLHAVTGFHRDSINRRLNHPLSTRNPALPRRQGRPPIHPDGLVGEPLFGVWEASGCQGARSLRVLMCMLIESLERHGECSFPPDVKACLLQMSESTINRLLRSRRHRSKYYYPMVRNRQARNRIQAAVPIRTFGEWADAPVGSLQIDGVMHAGGSSQGSHLCSLVMIDVRTGWTVVEVLLRLRQQDVVAALTRGIKRFPFAIRSVHSDNGSEFLNYSVQRELKALGIETTRGRPARSNDQARVEQRNWTVVRKRLGSARYSGTRARDAMAAFYDLVLHYTNFIAAMSKVTGSKREGAKVVHTYDEPQTPHARLLATGELDAKTERDLAVIFKALNPAQLQRRIDERQRALEKFARYIDPV